MGLNFDEPGVPTIEKRTCSGCGECATICPSKVVVMEDGQPEVVDGSFTGCIACGHCMMVCPTGSITVRGRGLMPEDIVELPPAEDRATSGQLDALLLSRRSVRQFQEREVDRTVVDQILGMTASAPMGIPPHEVGIVVFHGRQKVRTFAEEMGALFAKPSWLFNPVVLALMRPFIGKTQYVMLRDFVRPLLALLAQRMSEGIDAFTYDAPLAMLCHSSPECDPADCRIIATYAMLAAESFGLGSCMIGTAAALNQDKPLMAKYGIPKENKVDLLVVMGHPAVEFQRGVRRRLKSVAFA